MTARDIAFIAASGTAELWHAVLTVLLWCAVAVVCAAGARAAWHLAGVARKTRRTRPQRAAQQDDITLPDIPRGGPEVHPDVLAAIRAMTEEEPRG